MDVSVSRMGDRTVLKPTGPVDTLTADELQKALLEAIAQESGKVHLDFSAVPYLSSAGLRVLAVAAKALRERGERLRVTGVQVPVASVLNIANFNTFIDIETGRAG